MDIKLILEFLIMSGARAMGARAGGVGPGFWGAAGWPMPVVLAGIFPELRKRKELARARDLLLSKK